AKPAAKKAGKTAPEPSEDSTDSD
ncbi:MAG: hypothetical protein RLZZ415_422, partial [Pseudomonadota bacterium]